MKVAYWIPTSAVGFDDLSDISGQLASYKAYRHYIAVERNGVEEDRLPGLEQFTPNQIFWITYGYTWCINMSTEYLTRLVGFFSKRFSGIRTVFYSVMSTIAFSNFPGNV